MLGTTHATNAVLERRNLRRVAVLRIGGPATYSIRPMFGWPRDLVDAVSVGAEIVDGGIEFDGQDLSPLDTDAIARFLGRVGDKADGVVITSVFAPVSARHELLAAEVVKRELGEVHTSLVKELRRQGLPAIGLFGAVQASKKPGPWGLVGTNVRADAAASNPM